MSKRNGVVITFFLTLLSASRFAGPAQAGEKMRVDVVETSALIRTVFVTIFAEVILPDGSHAMLICGDRSNDKNCAKIEPIAPEKMPPEATTCNTVGGETTCVTKNPGTYEQNGRAMS